MRVNDSPNIYSPKYMKNNTLSIIQNQEESLKNKGFGKKFTTEVPTTPKKMKKKKIKKKLVISSSFSKNNELTNKNLKEGNLKNLGEVNIYNNNQNDINKLNIGYCMKSEDKFVSGETERNRYNNRRIIDRIRINCFCIYFGFCFAKKKKNIQNVLMDEGMEIIVENLDILNVFKKLYNLNKLEESFKLNEIFDMTDKCKTKIDALDQAFLKKLSKGQ